MQEVRSPVAAVQVDLEQLPTAEGCRQGDEETEQGDLVRQGAEVDACPAAGPAAVDLLVSADVPESHRAIARACPCVGQGQKARDSRWYARSPDKSWRMVWWRSTLDRAARTVGMTAGPCPWLGVGGDRGRWGAVWRGRTEPRARSGEGRPHRPIAGEYSAAGVPDQARRGHPPTRRRRSAALSISPAAPPAGSALRASQER